MERSNVIIFAVLFVAIGLCGFAFGAAYEQAKHRRIYNETEGVYAKAAIEGLDSAMIKLREVNSLINTINAREDSINTIINEMINQ
jgi:uncharacterized Fe-S cluster-containing MiaB family protein